jgi:hypothetical protein
MALGASIGSRITDLIGSDYATVPDLSYKDLINAAFNEIVDSVFEDLLLKYSSNPGRLEGATEWLVEDKKILKVTRVDANSGGIERECAYVNRTEFAAAQDSNSIYFATAFSPVFHIDSKNAGAANLSIIPVCNGDGQEGRIWYFSYATDSTDLSAVTAATLNTSHNLPGTLIHAIVLKSCVNILSAYISNFIQDDEDSELQGMVEKQLMGLQANYTAEMSRFSDQSEGPSKGAE